MLTANSIVVNAEDESVAETGKLQIVCEQDEALKQAQWRIYKIGERDPYENEIHIDDKYASSVTIDLTEATADDMAKLGKTISENIKNDKITPDYTYKLDTSFNIETELPFGIYFLEMDPYDDGDRIWSTAPAILEVNDFEDENVVYPKSGSIVKEKPVPEKKVPNTHTGTETTQLDKYTLIISGVLAGALLVNIRSKKKEQE